MPRLQDVLPKEELKAAVLAEYEKRLILYGLTDERFRKKYNMTYAEFESKNIARGEHDWETENNAMQWEHAMEGIRHTLETIEKIKDAKD